MLGNYYPTATEELRNTVRRMVMSVVLGQKLFFEIYVSKMWVKGGQRALPHSLV